MAKVYRVREDAIAPDTAYSNTNRYAVAAHGWLWVHVKGDFYHSVATGGPGYWEDYELEELDGGGD